MPESSVLSVPDRFQYTPIFIGMYQHLFVCHLLHSTNFQQSPPCPHLKFF